MMTDEVKIHFYETYATRKYFCLIIINSLIRETEIQLCSKRVFSYYISLT